MKQSVLRFAAQLWAMLAVLLLFVAAALPAHADDGDMDEITHYTVTVDTRADGSADITYELDWNVIGGSLDHLHRGHPGDRAFLAKARGHNIPLIGIGTGSFILAEEGLLTERRASIHPHQYDVFTQRFPLVYAEQGLDFIDEGDVLTCPGGISTLTLVTALIRDHAGNDIATTTSRRLSLSPHTPVTPRPANIALIPDSRLRRAVTIVEQYLTHPLTAARLAEDVKLSERQLNRLFHAEFGKTAREFIRSARLRYACWLLKNSQQSVTDIARRMRFSDCAHFIRHFQTEYGCTPGVWRTLQN